VSGRASSIKVVEMTEVGTPISLDALAVHPDCWCVCLCYLHFAPENPEFGEQRYDIGYHTGRILTYLCKQVGKPSQNTAQPHARAHGCVNDDLRADGQRKGWGF